jgi:hypothetical protein
MNKRHARNLIAILNTMVQTNNDFNKGLLYLIEQIGEEAK